MEVDYNPVLVFWQMARSAVVETLNTDTSSSDIVYTSMRMQYSVQIKDFEPTTQLSTEQQLSRRSLIFGGIKKVFALGLGAVGISVALAVPSERQKKPAELAAITFREYGVDPTQFVIFDGHDVVQVSGQVKLKINERYAFAAEVKDISQNPDQVFTLEDIPSAEDQVPALIVYTECHQDSMDPQLSLIRRVLTRSKDVAADRVMFILSKSDTLIPGLVSPEKDNRSLELPVFFRLSDEKLPEEFLATYFPEFRFSSELLQEILEGTVHVYWRNFGSKLGHGALPDIYLIEKTPGAAA